MDDLLQNENLLMRYLDGELTGDEKLALEQRLLTDGELKDQLTSLQVAVQAIRQLGTTQKVSTVHTEMMTELKSKKGEAKVVSFGKIIRYTMTVAASLFILFIGYKVYLGAQLSPEKLYSESFVDFNVSVSRGGTTTVSEIEKNYQQKNYTAIVNATRSFHLDAKDSLLIGLSYLHTDAASKAISFFHAISISESDFRQDAEFYLSLAYLKNRSYEKALPLMQKIAADPAHLYHGQLNDDVIEKVKTLNNK